MKFFKNRWLVGLVAFIGWALVFGIIYAQSPLYTSNQNRYFLNGLARAGYGTLSHDWLANTLDALPLFSALVQFTYPISKSGILFYFYYALLMGVYLVGILGIVDHLFNIRQSKTRQLVFITLFLGLHSAAFHYLLSRVLGTEQPFLFEGGVASQRLLGQVLQPSSFGVFLVFSIYLFLEKRYFLSLVSLAVAVYFHSVYLMGAAFLVIGYMWVLFREKKTIKAPLLIGIEALLLVLPALLYTYYIFKPTSADITRQVNEVLVGFRNSEHALVSSWLDWTVGVQAALALAALAAAWKKRLFPTLAVVLLGIVSLTAIQVITNNETLALLYPWRMSVVLVPVSTCILLAFGVTKLFDLRKTYPPKFEFWTGFTCIVVLAGLMFVGVTRFQIESARQQTDPARPVMKYVFEHKSPGDVYLVHVKLEDFRLAAAAPIYVDFKSIPYRDVDVLEWYRRFKQANLFYQRAKCDVLPDLYDEGVTHAVIPTDFPATCPGLVEVYRDTSYVLYQLTSQ